VRCSQPSITGPGLSGILEFAGANRAPTDRFAKKALLAALWIFP
jgi:hypothetical protein